ncbi:MAG: hypothetical protein LRY51_09740 [Geovibrio sp.]|jgi:hypothetical protein|nr:hypothetical protein [Geovibrio sp.]
MIHFLTTVLTGVGKQIIIAAVSERVLKKAIIQIMLAVAEKTPTKLDDEIIAEIAEQLNAVSVKDALRSVGAAK